MNRRTIILVTVLLPALTVMVAALSWSQQVEPGAQDPPATAPTTETEAARQNDDDDDRVKLLNADSLFRDAAAGIYHCKGNVIFSHRGVLLYCDEAEYYDETHSAKATGNLEIVDPEATITGDLMTANFEDEIITVTGNVRVVAQKKGDEDAPPNDNQQEDRQTEESERLEDYAKRLTVITCDELEYHYNEDIRKVIAIGNVKAVQEDKTVWARRAVFEQLTDEITLTGNVRLKTADGDELHTEEAVVSIAEDWIRTGQVSGVTFRRRGANDNGAE